MAFLSRATSALSCVPGAFFSYFPHLRQPYQKIHTLNETFARIEKVAFAHFSSPKRDEPSSMTEQRRKVSQDIQSTVYDGKTLAEWMEKAQKILDKMQPEALYAHEQEELDLLRQQLLALRYRSGVEWKGCDEDQGKALYDQVEPIIRRYVSLPRINPGRQSPGDGLAELTLTERHQLLLACTRYPLLIKEFIKRHEENKEGYDAWTADFVKWALRSGCNVGVFVKTPLERRELSEAHLDKRSGAVHGKKGIHFTTLPMYGSMVKVLAIKVDGRMQPIQGDYKKERVHLKNLVSPTHEGMTLTMEKVMKTFKEKTSSYGSVEYLDRGICNWNAIELGSYNDDSQTYDRLEGGQLLKQLHYIAPVVTFSEAQVLQRYHLPSGTPPLEDGKWAIVLRGSRQKANLNVLEAHGYLEIVHRTGDSYSVFPIGVQPIALPNNPIEKLFYLSATKKAALHYPDESFYLSQRQHAGIFIPLLEEDEPRLHEAIKELYENGQNGDLLFQFGGMNCAYHVQQVFDQVVAAPFYEKMRSAVASVASSKNAFKELWADMQMKRALEGLNHDVLDEMLTELVDDLWKSRDPDGHLQELLDESIKLMNRMFDRNMPLIDLKKIDFSQESVKKDIKKLLFQSTELIRFYRLDLFESQTDQAVLTIINKIVHAMPWRWAKRLIINLVMLILGSWRWEVIKEKKKDDPSTEAMAVKNVLSNPLLHEGYLHHPAALWRWNKQHTNHLEKFESTLRRITA
jgi:hypothetical protein